MAGHSGNYDCRVDSKGRLKLPAGLLRSLPKGQSGKYVINKGLDNNLDLYTEESWDKITAKLESLNKFNSRHREFLRAFYKNVTHLEIDSNDRILIPKKTAELINLKDDAVIFCYGSNIEIWAKDVFDTATNNNIENFSDMADDVFGNLNWKE
ncbi:MAG: hypothetical protein LC105_11785 [Chitinophagales bacterium]|nr:hypothetical protein [Chitinophagales bacterium]MCZ2394530.1 hypothetical protein [Chitinophagales bacterium]